MEKESEKDERARLIQEEKERIHKEFDLTRLDTKKQTFLVAYAYNRADVSAGCGSAKISRSTFYNWTRENGDLYDEIFAAIVLEIREASIDWVESKLKDNISKGKEVSIIFYLKTIGKKRGYVETQEIVQSKGSDKTDKEIDERIRELVEGRKNRTLKTA